MKLSFKIKPYCTLKKLTFLQGNSLPLSRYEYLNSVPFSMSLSGRVKRHGCALPDKSNLKNKIVEAK